MANRSDVQAERKRPGRQENAVALDDIDLKILELLERDARISYSSLAERVGLSRVSVKERVLELTRRGVIERFTIQIPAKHMGKPLPVFFTIGFPPDLIEISAARIAEHPDVVIVYQMSGLNSLHVHGFFKDVDEVSVFVNSFVASIPGVQSIASEFLFKRFKSDRMLLV
jgi:DNA-binding Lrp family transcriptional regulator